MLDLMPSKAKGGNVFRPAQSQGNTSEVEMVSDGAGEVTEEGHGNKEDEDEDEEHDQLQSSSSSSDSGVESDPWSSSDDSDLESGLTKKTPGRSPATPVRVIQAAGSSTFILVYIGPCHTGAETQVHCG